MLRAIPGLTIIGSIIAIAAYPFYRTMADSLGLKDSPLPRRASVSIYISFCSCAFNRELAVVKVRYDFSDSRENAHIERSRHRCGFWVSHGRCGPPISRGRSGTSRHRAVHRGCFRIESQQLTVLAERIKVGFVSAYNPSVAPGKNDRRASNR